MKDYSKKLVVDKKFLLQANFRRATENLRLWQRNGTAWSHHCSKVKKIDKVEYLKQKIREARRHEP